MTDVERLRTDRSAEARSLLAESGDVPAVTALVRNTGAELAEPTLEVIVDSFSTEEPIAGLISERGGLPLRIAERMVTLVTQELQRKMHAEGRVLDGMAPGHAATELLLLDPEGALLDLAELLWRLIDEGKVGGDILVRAAEAKERELVEVALSRLTRLPLIELRKRVAGGAIGPLLEQAGLSAADQAPVAALLEKGQRASPG